jgi:phenylalanyl-tRNA synthetase alpha chain
MSKLPDPSSLEKEFESHFHTLKSLQDVDPLRVAWLGRKGRLTLLLKQLGDLSIDEKRVWGPRLNQLKTKFEDLLATREKDLAASERHHALEKDTLDTSLPGSPVLVGRSHPLNQVMEEIASIFRGLGFVTADGPEIESEFNNFDALNVPPNHPARDMQDTFYLDIGQQQLSLPQIGDPQARHDPILLRTHTSPVQIRVMQTYPPPIAIVCPGRVYRHEAQDATHSAIFHQMEGLMVDQGLSFADLKGTLSRFAQLYFAPNVRTRFKPSFFPFTEPSAQMDVSCWQCDGTGCRTCKQTGWIEIMGAGMVNPKVLQTVHIDIEKFTGFAFGMGIERIAMLKYGIDDLRLFYENDIRFLQQF